jgi:hypothetical protein
MSNLIQFKISEGGSLTTIYSDQFASLYAEVGSLSVSRASHVEPDGHGQWIADMAPVGGPMLGPFALRQTALDAEVAWLNDNIF